MARRRDRYEPVKQHPGIYRRNGRYVVRIYDPQTRKRSDHYPDENNLRAAEALKRGLEAKKARRGLGTDETVDSFVDRWLKDYTDRRSAGTLQNYRYDVMPFARDFKGVKLGDVTRQVARVWLVGGIVPPSLAHQARRWKDAEERPDGNVKTRSHAHSRNTLRAMYSDALRDELVEVNPFSDLRLAGSRGRRDIVVLNGKEVDDLAKIARIAFQTPDFAAMILTAAWTGMRPGELYGLEWQDVDFRGYEIAVRRQRLRTGVLGPPKNKKARTIVLTPGAHDALKDLPHSTRDDFVFHTTRHSSWTHRVATYYWTRTRDAFIASLPESHHLRQRERTGTNRPFEFYELRHFCATYLLDLTDEHGRRIFSSADVAHQLGHTDGGKLVQSTYGHPEEEAIRDRLKKAMWADRKAS